MIQTAKIAEANSQQFAKIQVPSKRALNKLKINRL